MTFVYDCFILSFSLLGQTGISYDILCRHENLVQNMWKQRGKKLKSKQRRKHPFIDELSSKLGTSGEQI